MFDEIEFSKRTLTRNWNKFNPAEHVEFVKLFEQVLEKSYVGQNSGLSNEKVDFTKDEHAFR